MAKYSKGANAERELLHLLHEKGFAVVRVAGSGASKMPAPDGLAFKKGIKFAFECKVRKGNYLNIPKTQMIELVEWSKKAGIKACIAWKVPRKGWLFLSPQDFKENKKAFSINLETALKKGKNKLFSLKTK